MTTKDYNFRTYAGGPDCNHVTYRIKNTGEIPTLVWCKDPMFSYTAEETYPWHSSSLRSCIVEMLHADIYNEEYEALKKYNTKDSYIIRGTEHGVIKTTWGFTNFMICSKTKALRARAILSRNNDITVQKVLKIKLYMPESHIERKYKV